MSQNLEIEFKNILMKEEYQRLIEFFHIPDTSIFSQENHYFDTPDFFLKEKESALRIRKKAGQFELTLKQPAGEGLLETNQLISAVEAAQAINKSLLPKGIVKEIILQMNIPYENIVYFGSLITKRTEINFQGGLLVFDHSFYLNQEDFELEYEVENYQNGKKVFNRLLQEHGIPQRETLNKIRRFYQQKYKDNVND